jgi:hypothetical protein
MKDNVSTTFGPKILPRVSYDYDGKLKQVLSKIERNGIKKIGLTTTKINGITLWKCPCNYSHKYYLRTLTRRLETNMEFRVRHLQ